MALIQINQKLLHITITLLIYGVRMESAKCPDVCHCVETSVSYESNGTKAMPLDRVQRLSPAGDDSMIGLNEVEDESDNRTERNTKTAANDIFVRNFSTTDSGESFLFKNSKEIRVKRTLNFSNSEAAVATTTTTTMSPDRKTDKTRHSPIPPNRPEMDDRKIKEFFTYQITCNEVGDLKVLSLWALPNATTQLIIQRADLQSVGAFFQLLKESSIRFPLLTDLSITSFVLDSKEENNSTESVSRQKFLPFASLQNPQQRVRNETERMDFTSKLLVILNLSNNTLRYLPKDIFKPYPNLQTLDLSNNLIDHLDDEVFSTLGSLLRLDLHSNKISALNELVFKNLTKLLTLDMSKNSISNIAPSTFQYLSSLNTLILSDNPLSVKQQSMILLGTGKRLQIVDASKTGLKQIPGTLERSVQTLNLEGNYLSSIQCGDLDSYSLLTYLNLGSNKISYVEDDALGRLELLTNLRINDNNLFQIPKSLPNNLEILNLSYNNIQNITNSDFLNLSLLKELYISYNQVNNIEENSFDNLSELRVLDLSHNPILILPNMYGLVKLSTLNLSYFTNIPNRFAARYEEFPAQAPENIKVLNLESSPLLTRTFLQDTKTLQSFANLEELYLRFSNLTSLRKDIFTFLPRLRILEVEGNPWHCEREILKLCEWLKSRKNGGSTEEEEANDVNTAHCATPPSLHKKPLVALSWADFEEEPSHYREIEKLNPANQMTLKEIQSKNEIYFKSFQKQIDNRGIGGTQDLSKASPKSEIDLTESEGDSQEDKQIEQVSSNFVLNNNNSDVNGDNGTEATLDCSSNGTQLQESSTSAPDKSWTNDGIAKSDVTTTEAALVEVTKAEAMHVKDTSDLQHNGHQRLILATFVGAVMLATTVVTVLHIVKSRKDRTYERQTHDIEVHSICSVGNELW